MVHTHTPEVIYEGTGWESVQGDWHGKAGLAPYDGSGYDGPWGGTRWGRKQGQTRSAGASFSQSLPSDGGYDGTGWESLVHLHEGPYDGSDYDLASLPTTTSSMRTFVALLMGLVVGSGATLAITTMIHRRFQGFANAGATQPLLVA
jgi:hypothetical protein